MSVIVIIGFLAHTHKKKIEKAPSNSGKYSL